MNCPHCSLRVSPLESGGTEARCSFCGGSFALDSPADDLAKTPAGGRFELLDRAGAGSFGTVWKARDRVLGRLVALKILHPGALETSQALQRFQREARLVSQLRHPGIVPVHEAIEIEGRPVMVSDLVQGLTIDRYREGRALPPREAAKLVRQAAEALDYAHSMGIVHRDIKPANLMIESNDSSGEQRLVVLDFGLALAEGHGATLTTDGQLLGTPAYMSPEQALGSRGVDRRSDVYSLGVVLYELLTGVLPFRGGSTSILQQLMQAQPKPPRAEKPDLPRDLESICLRAMAKLPRDRYETARELAEDLGRFLEGEPVLARPLGRGERFVRWVARNPVIAGLGGATALLLLVVAFVATLSAVRLQRERDVALENLYHADVAEARARIRSPFPGRHFEALRALDRARQRHASVEVRNEVIAALTQVDVETGRTWRMRPPGDNQNNGICFDRDLELCASAWRDTVHFVVLPESTRVHAIPFVPWGSALSPDGRYYLNYKQGPGGRFYIYGVSDGRVVASGKSSLWGGNGFFPQDGHRAIMCLEDGTLVTYELPSGRELRRVRTGVIPGIIVVDPLGERVAYREGDDTKFTWIADLETGRLSPVVSEMPEGAFAWSPDGSRLVLVRAASTQVLDLRYGTRVTLEGLRRAVEWGWNPNSDLVVTRHWDGLTRLFDASTGRQLVTVPGHFVSWSSDGTRLRFASGSEEVGYWNVARGRECRTRRDPTSDTRFLGSVVNAPATLLATASEESVLLWDLELGEVVARVTDAQADISFNKDGDTLFTHDEAGFRAWPVERDHASHRVACGPPRTLIRPEALEGKNWRLFDVERGRLWTALHGRRLLRTDLASGDTLSAGPHSQLGSVAVSPDGQWVATASSFDVDIKVWNAETGALRFVTEARGHGHPIWSADGRWFVTRSYGVPTRLWKVPDFTLHRSLEGERQAAVFLGRGDQMLEAVGADGFRITETASGHELATLRSPSGAMIDPPTTSPNGEWLIFHWSGESILDIWDLRLLRSRLAERGLDWASPPFPPLSKPVATTRAGG